MNNDQRLADIDKNLQLLRQKLAYLEGEFIITADPNLRFQLTQQIEETKALILKYESEYRELSSGEPVQNQQNPHKLPESGIAEFVGRDEDLTRLDEGFQRSGRVMIAGMPGIGKTELALRYGWREWKKETYHGGICWLNVAESEPGEQILSYARRDLRLTLPDEGTLAERVRYCWRNWVAGDALIIFDDVRDYGQIEDYLPPKEEKRFKVLITTRCEYLSATVEMVPVEELTEMASLALLRSYVSDGRIDEQIEQAKALCLDLGYLPLALELVARLLRRRKEWTLAKIREKLVENGLEDKSLVKNPKFDREMTAKRGVKAAFDLSWQELENEPEARKLALSLSLFALAPFPKLLIDDLFPDEDADDIEEWLTDSLVHLNLVKALGEGWYELHTLIRRYLRDKLEESEIADEAKQSYCRTMVEKAEDIPEFFTLEEIAIFNPFVPHLQIAGEELDQSLEKNSLVPLFGCLGKFYKDRGLYGDAEPYYERCLTLARKCLGEDHPDLGIAINDLAVLYYSQGRYTEAEPLYLEALELRKSFLGKNNSDVATSLNNLAALYYSQGRYIEAEPLYLEALKIEKSSVGENHPDIAPCLNNLAELYEAQGRYDEAEPLYREGMELCKKRYGEDDPYFANSLSSLAGFHEAQGRYAEAEPLYLKALEIRKHLFGEDHPDFASSLDELAGLYTAQGRYTEAEPLYLKALEIRKNLLGNNHPHVIIGLNNLAGLYETQEQYDQAKPLYLKALEFWKLLHGKNHPHFASALNNLALLYQYQERYTEAEILYLEALEIRKNIFGDDHPDVATSLNNLAGVYESQERYIEAESLYKQSLEIRRNSLVNNHSDIAQSCYNLAGFYEEQERYTEAEPLFLEALKIAIKTLGEAHHRTQTIRQYYQLMISNRSAD